MSDSDEESPQPRAGSGGSGAAAADDPLDPSSLPALFWDDMPANPEEHPDYMALKVRARPAQL
jgi:hypothetical protein